MYSIVSVTWEQLRFAPERLYYRVIDLVQKMRRLPNTGVLESSRLQNYYQLLYLPQEMLCPTDLICYTDVATSSTTFGNPVQPAGTE